MLVYLHDKNLACFIRKLVQNLMSLFLKAKESSQEMPKTEIDQKNDICTFWRRRVKRQVKAPWRTPKRCSLYIF